MSQQAANVLQRGTGRRTGMAWVDFGSVGNPLIDADID